LVEFFWGFWKLEVDFLIEDSTVENVMNLVIYSPAYIGQNVPWNDARNPKF
jgi:hypothetical protein